ncbi:MAG: hypothetical protein WA797_02680, partial [Acidimicrobiales bacterium]
AEVVVVGAGVAGTVGGGGATVVVVVAGSVVVVVVVEVVEVTGRRWRTFWAGSPPPRPPIDKVAATSGMAPTNTGLTRRFRDHPHIVDPPRRAPVISVPEGPGSV